MEIKHIYTEIRILARMEQINYISEWGLEKLKEFRYLAELHENKVKNLSLPDVVQSFYCVDNSKSLGKVDKCENQCTGCWQVVKGKQ